MANILHLDENELACRAMRGILTRSGHRVITAADAPEAWRLIRELVKIDLVICELKLKGENGISFISRLRADCFLKNIPVLVYSDVSDQAVVKKALSLGIQNYLIKPYNDHAIYSEIAKVSANPWRNLFFEEDKSFCAQMGIPPAVLRTNREKLIEELSHLAQLFPQAGQADTQKHIAIKVEVISSEAEGAGAWGIVDLMAGLKTLIEAEHWVDIPPTGPNIEYANRLIFCHIHPDHLPDGFLSDQEKKEKEEAREKSRWVDVDVLRSGPLVAKQTIDLQLENLQTCPVIDSVAASFGMFADGQASNLNRVSDLVCKDPGLAAQVLISIHKLEREGMSEVEDPRTAIGLLGELRLNSLSKTLLTVEERLMYTPPMSWPHFWMFQMGVAKIAQYTCKYLEYKDLESNAYTAGLIHDIGKLLLMRLYPFALQAISFHAKQTGIMLQDAERRYLTISTHDMALKFAELHGLPKVYRNVIKYIDKPLEATEDSELIAAVSLAKMLCVHNHVGNSGETARDQCPSVEETDAWQVLKNRVFPSFNLKQFESQVHAYSKELRLELLGRMK